MRTAIGIQSAHWGLDITPYADHTVNAKIYLWPEARETAFDILKKMQVKDVKLTTLGNVEGRWLVADIEGGAPEDQWVEFTMFIMGEDNLAAMKARFSQYSEECSACVFVEPAKESTDDEIPF
jgi:hypothetical protein